VENSTGDWGRATPHANCKLKKRQQLQKTGLYTGENKRNIYPGEL
jgi:hypothetical protein